MRILLLIVDMFPLLNIRFHFFTIKRAVSWFCSYLFLCVSRLWNGSFTESYNVQTVSKAFISSFEKYIEICEYQGHPTTVLCKLSFRRRKYHPGFSITRGRLKIARWPFKAYLINFLQFSEVWFFTFHTPG